MVYPRFGRQRYIYLSENETIDPNNLGFRRVWQIYMCSYHCKILIHSFMGKYFKADMEIKKETKIGKPKLFGY